MLLLVPGKISKISNKECVYYGKNIEFDLDFCTMQDSCFFKNQG